MAINNLDPLYTVPPHAALRMAADKLERDAFIHHGMSEITWIKNYDAGLAQIGVLCANGHMLLSPVFTLERRSKHAQLKDK